MKTAFSQSKVTYKVIFKTLFKYLEAYDDLFTDEALSISVSEVSSSTIESKPEDVWQVEVYLDYKPDFKNCRKRIKEHSDKLNLKIEGDINFENVKDQDWIAFYNENLKPIEVGRFFIVPKEKVDLCPADKTLLIIGASRAFGTGEHETTSLCIQALEYLKDKKFSRVLDLGTGSGILCFAAEKLWPTAKVFGCDIDDVALNIAKENANLNDSLAEFFNNEKSGIISSDHTSKYDLVVSNILAGPLASMSQDISAALEDKGYLILSGFLTYQSDELEKSFFDLGYKLVKKLESNNWISVTLQKNN